MVMNGKIEDYLAKAFSEQSKAAARNAAYALKAEQDGHPQLARLFRAVSNAESVHARRFLLLMRGKIGSTEENLEAALESELKAEKEYYPPMVEASKNASKAVKKAFGQSMTTDGEHAKLYQEAKEDMLKKSDAVYFVCQICGHIHRDQIPDNCPVCEAVPGRFRQVV
jgi:rubrerythrin